MRIKQTIPVALLSISFLAACGETVDDNGEEAAANEIAGKSDSLVGQLAFGLYTNESSKAGQLTSLELIEAAKSELPGAHYEGRFRLEENTSSGSKSTEGFFNAYRYRSVNYIRFETEAGDPATASEKFAFTVEGNMIRFETTAGTLFQLNRRETGITLDTYECSYGVSESEYLPYEASDPYGRTPVELIGVVTLAGLATADSHAVSIVENAANAEGVSVEEYLDQHDDDEVSVYELAWFSTAFELVRGYAGDTEVGYIFDYGFEDVIAEISDGDIKGCNDGECSFDIATSFPEDTGVFFDDPVTTKIGFFNNPEELTELMVAQLRQGLAGAQDWDDYSDDTVEELLDQSDDNGFNYYEGDDIQWVQWYGGDNEVGAFFEKGTTNLVGVVGDGDVSACVPAE